MIKRLCQLALLASMLVARCAYASVSVETVTFQISTAGATTTVTTGFQYKAAILISHQKTSTGETAGARMSYCFADGTTVVGITSSADDAVATTNAGKGWTNAQCYWVTNGTPNLATGGQLNGVVFNATPNMVLTFNATPNTANYVTVIGFGGADITNVKVGSSTLSTGTGNQSYTGVGFAGDAFFYLSGRNVTTGLTAHWRQDIGFALSSSKRWALTTLVLDGQTVSGSVNGMSKLTASQFAMGQTDSNGNDYLADFVSSDSDGFTINKSDAPPSAYGFAYLAIKGGSWDCGTQAKPATATTQTVATTSFTPKMLGYVLSSPTALDTFTSNAVLTYGAATTTSVRGYAGGYHNDAINSVAKSSGSGALISHEMNATANADFTSFQANGWTITWDAAGTAFQSAWWALGDPVVAAATTSSGLITGSTFLPITYAAPPVALTITTTTLASGTASTVYAGDTLAATGGSSPYTWSIVTDVLPPGLTLTASTGAIAGTPTTAGTYAFTARATDSVSATNDKALVITIAAGGANLFADDFESDDTDLVPSWTARNGTNATLNTNPSFSHGGSNSGQFYHNIAAGTPAPQDSNTYVTYIHSSSLTHFFLRGYLYMKTPEIGLDTFIVNRKIIWWSDSTSSGFSQIDWSNFIVLWTGSGGSPTPSTLWMMMGGNGGGCAGTVTTNYNLTSFSWDTWYSIEVEVQLNTSGASDGVLRVWKDGTLAYTNTAVNWRGTCTGDARYFSLGRQTNRTNSEQIQEYRYWDDVILRSTYIGP